MINRNCKNCEYFEEYDSGPPLNEQVFEGDTVGSCKRYPPVLVAKYECSTNDFNTPSVVSSDWCGEFKANVFVAS